MLTVRLIAEAAAAHYGVRYREIISMRRGADVCKARLAVYWLATQLTNHTLFDIGRALGDRDHTTVLRGRDTVVARRAADANYEVELQQLATDLLALDWAIDRFGVTLPADLDAEAIAKRILATDRGADSASHDDIVALASAVLGAAVAAPITNQEVTDRE